MNDLIADTQYQSPYATRRNFIPKLDSVSVLRVTADDALETVSSSARILAASKERCREMETAYSLQECAEEQALSWIAEQPNDICGCYFLTGAFTNAHILAMEESDLPFVIVDYSQKPGYPPSIREGRNCIKSPGSQMSAAAIEHLKKIGCEKIGIIAEGYRYPPLKEILIDFPLALRRNGLVDNYKHVLTADGRFPAGELAAAVKNCLNLPNVPDAFVVTSVALAREVLALPEFAASKNPPTLFALDPQCVGDSPCPSIATDFAAMLDSLFDLARREVFKQDPNLRFSAIAPYILNA